jgi:glycosyltransferase involved in cell wall biosynthesis
MSDLVKRICHITTVHPRQDIRIFLKECKSLSQKYKVFLVVADDKGDEIIGNLNIVGVNSGNPSRIKRFIIISFRTYIKARKLDCDLYHFHDPEFLFWGLILKLKGKKVIYDVHEDVPGQIMSKGYINPIFRKLISKLASFIEKFISSRLTAVVTVTPAINDRFNRYNKFTFLINNYPRVEELNYSGTQTKDGICYVGGITRIRGLEEVIDSLETAKIKLNLVGNFESESFKTSLNGKPGWEFVNYLGYLSRVDTIKVMSSSYAGIVTFHEEPNHISAKPTKIFEYMLAGIPVIASDFPLWREFFDKHQCGICVNPKDPAEISQAISFIVNNSGVAQKMGENGRKAVLDFFSWNSEEEKLFEIYRKILG